MEHFKLSTCLYMLLLQISTNNKSFSNTKPYHYQLNFLFLTQSCGLLHKNHNSKQLIYINFIASMNAEDGRCEFTIHYYVSHSENDESRILLDAFDLSIDHFPLQLIKKKIKSLIGLFEHKNVDIILMNSMKADERHIQHMAGPWSSITIYY